MDIKKTTESDGYIITSKSQEREVIFLMACEKFKQFAIVRSDSAETFENDLNARMYELRNASPEVLFNEQGQTLTATIEYTVKRDPVHEERDPVTDGILLTCSDCPYCEHITKRDGTPDMRAKTRNCKFAEYGRTYPESNACSVLYQLIINGGARICLTESE